ncbi:MAG: hypothetical protein RL481_1958 [Pseudomonadota bacterium]|jgi:hypothetical protein
MNFKPNMIVLGMFSAVLNVAIAMSVVTISANLEHRSGPASSVANLGQFLLAYPSADYRGTAMRQELWQRHKDQITYWRIVDSDNGAVNLNAELAKARRSFAHECAELQGDVIKADKRAPVFVSLTGSNHKAELKTVVHPDICIGGKGRALGALYAYPLDGKRLLGSGTQQLAAFFVTRGEAVGEPVPVSGASNVTSSKSASLRKERQW